MTHEDEGQLVDLVQAYLEERGWEPAGGEGWRWVEHTFTNDHGTLGVDFLQASPPSLGFTFETETKQVRLQISFDDVQPILDAITQAQEQLSEDTWPPFVEHLLKRSSRIVRIAEEEDEEDSEITTVEEGRAALREADWEYLDDEDS